MERLIKMNENRYVLKLYKVVTLVILGFILSACGDKFKLKHRVEVWHNNESNEVILDDLIINNENIKDIKGIKIKKRDNKKESFGRKIQFSTLDSNLEVKIFLVLDGKKEYAHCRIQTEGQYCVLRMVYFNSRDFRCTCDGMYL